MTEEKHQIDQGLLTLKTGIDDLNIDGANTRRHPERNLEAIANSIQRFGQRTPLVVQREGMIVRKGNGTLQAARFLEWTHIAALIVEEDALEAVAYSITDNKSSDTSEFDWESLSTTMKELKDQGVDFLRLGWEGYELEPLLEADWTPPPPEPGGMEGNGKTPAHSINFSDEQWPVIQQAIERIQVNEPEVKSARAVELICANYLAGEQEIGGQ